jgi:hypothetical protein
LFDELVLSDLIPWGIAAVIVSGGLGLLRPSRLRSFMIWIWSLLPLLLSWAALTTLSYNLVRRSREIQAGG